MTAERTREKDPETFEQCDIPYVTTDSNAIYF